MEPLALQGVQHMQNLQIQALLVQKQIMPAHPPQNEMVPVKDNMLHQNAVISLEPENLFATDDDFDLVHILEQCKNENVVAMSQYQSKKSQQGNVTINMSK